MGIIYLNSLLNILDNFFLGMGHVTIFFRHAHLQVRCGNYSVYIYMCVSFLLVC
jgi:hypothetical protein